MAAFRNSPCIRSIQFVCAVLVCIAVASCSETKPPVRIAPQTKFYLLSGPDYWGDYGHVLIQGYADDREQSNGVLEVSRTGPFMPPITFPRSGEDQIVVTDEFRKELEAAQIGRLSFRMVIKKLVVEIPWQDWDLSAVYPEELPDSGDPDDYLDRRHSPQAADALGDLWQVILNEGAIVETDIQPETLRGQILVHTPTWNGDAIFWGTDPPDSQFNVRRIVVSDRGKQWLEEHVGKWVHFHEIQAK